MKIVYTYRVVCQKLSAPELGPYITYGILAAALARRCTAAQLDPCHLLDVVEDAIGG